MCIRDRDRAMRNGHNQYAPMTGVPVLRQAIAEKVLRCYGATVNADTEITVTSGATEAIFNAIHAVVRAGEEVIVLDPAYDCYEPVSYTHLDVYKRQCSPSPCRLRGAGCRRAHAPAASPRTRTWWRRP